ncbi:MAG: hypothetical protein ABI615_05210 [Chthoniobacterales bacterium]
MQAAITKLVAYAIHDWMEESKQRPHSFAGVSNPGSVCSKLADCVADYALHRIRQY